MAQLFSASYSLVKKVPANRLGETLDHLATCIHDEETMLQIGQRLNHIVGVATCEETNKPFILCPHNKDAASYRSPWSNHYQPAFEDGLLPPEFLRNLEVAANEAFLLYTRLYYDDAVSSVYFLDTNPNEFVCVLLVQKTAEARKKLQGGAWESCHVVNVKLPPDGKNATYYYSSSACIQFGLEQEAGCRVDLSCSAFKQGHETRPIDNDLYGPKHVQNLINLVEVVEGQLRSALENVYIQWRAIVCA